MLHFCKSIGSTRLTTTYIVHIFRLLDRRISMICIMLGCLAESNFNDLTHFLLLEVGINQMAAGFFSLFLFFCIVPLCRCHTIEDLLRIPSGSP